MALRTIIETPDPRLRVKSAPVEEITDETRALIADMFETMYDAPGIGLAAIQVGVPQRILVIDLQDRAAEPGAPELPADGGHETAEPVRNPRVFINPEILWSSEEWSVYSEGCLSVPEMFADVERPARIRARWLDDAGAVHEEELEGLLATCLQHEMDHLNGVLFVDHLSRLKREMILKKLEKLRKSKAA
jgi:peptide deformylase